MKSSEVRISGDQPTYMSRCQVKRCQSASGHIKINQVYALLQVFTFFITAQQVLAFISRTIEVFEMDWNQGQS